MGDLTANFSRSEFKCKCGNCKYDTVDHALVDGLQDVVDHFTKQEDSEVVDRISATINSGNRCPAHDRAIKIKIARDKGVPFVDKPSKSQHLYSRAADFKMEYVLKRRDANGHLMRKPINDDLIADYLENKYIGRYGIGRYNGRTHFDTRSDGPARWDKR